MRPVWLCRHQAQHPHIPGSQRKGIEMVQQILAPLEAQISMYFGGRNGTLESLQEGALKLASGEPVICDECKRNIWNGGHAKDCPIVEAYGILFKDK